MTTTESGGEQVARHRTAISRPQLSAPLQAAARHGYLDGSRSVFDYGCGRGNDIAILETAGIKVSGWDPHYRPDKELQEAGVVNLGYVLNVIEDEQERRTVLSDAIKLAKQLLIISVITAQSDETSRYREYSDGVITERGTFQRYFLQEEIVEFVESVTKLEALAVGPGIFFVFVDKVEEQRFLANRRRKKHDISHLLTLKPPAPGAKTWSDWVAFESHKHVLEQLWQRMLSLGRLPASDELPEEVNTYIDQELGSVRRAAQLTQIGFDPKSFNSSRSSRIDDLTVYFALNLFNRRQPYTQLPKELQRDVNVFFQSYSAAQDLGRDLLFSVGETETIYNACLEASQHNIGFLDGTHSLQLHSDLVEELPPPLRTYVGCAEKLYGDVDQADLVKIHIRSGKVTFLEYESFEKSATPKLILRTKVNLREREVDYFYYQDAVNSQLLYQKSKYMSGGQPGYETQRRFDQRLNKLGLFDFEGFGPPSDVFFETLEREGLRIKGRTITRIKPELSTTT